MRLLDVTVNLHNLTLRLPNVTMRLSNLTVRLPDLTVRFACSQHHEVNRVLALQRLVLLEQ